MITVTNSFKYFKCLDITLPWALTSGALQPLALIQPGDRKGREGTIAPRTEVNEFPLFTLALPPSHPSKTGGSQHVLSFFLVSLHVISVLPSLAPFNQLTFLSPFSAFQSKFWKSLPISLKKALSPHFFFCRLVCSTQLPIFTTPLNTMRTPRGNHSILSDDEMSTNALAVLNGLGSDSHHPSSFIFIGWPSHLLLDSFFPVDPVSTNILTDPFFFFLVKYVANWHFFHRGLLLQWLNTEHLFFHPAVNRSQFLNQVFNISFEHIKWCHSKFSLIKIHFILIFSF